MFPDDLELVEPEPLEPDSVEEAVDVLSEVLPTNREQALRIVRALRGWSGPLPPPDELREYENAVPGTAKTILDDFERRSILESDATRHMMRATDRELTLLEKEQDLRVEESKSDVAMRSWAQKSGVGFVLITCAGATWTLALAPIDSDGARVFAAALWFLPLIVFGAAVLLRGRYSDNERDVILETLPRIADAVSRRTTNQDDSPRESDRKQLTD